MSAVPPATPGAVLVTTDVRGQTPECYARHLDRLGPALRAAAGFVSHCAFPVEGGWRYVECWASRAQSEAFYASVVEPIAPPGRLRRTVVELRHLMTR